MLPTGLEVMTKPQATLAGLPSPRWVCGLAAPRAPISLAYSRICASKARTRPGRAGACADSSEPLYRTLCFDVADVRR